MPELNNDLYSTVYSSDSSNLRQGAEPTSSTTATKGDAQYPYPDQDVVLDENGVPIEPTFQPLSAHAPLLQKPDAVLLGAVHDDESNQILEITTRTASVQKQRTTQDIRNNKNRLDANNARQKEAHDKYVRDFIRAMRNSRAMAGLKLFIKIAAPIAAAAATVATLGAAAPVATALCAYALTATVTDSAGGPNIGLADNMQKGMAAALKEGGASDQEAQEWGGLAAGAFALLAALATGSLTKDGALKMTSQVLMSNPEFAGMIAGNIVRVSSDGTDEEASYVEMGVTLATGLAATVGTVKGAGDKGKQAAGKSALDKILPVLTKWGSYTSAGLSVVNSSVGGAQGGLEFEKARHEYDMKINQYGMQLAEKQADETQRKLQNSTHRFSQISEQAQENAQKAIELNRKRHQTNVAIIEGESRTTV